MYPGIEIIGGFKGIETERKPEGSIYGTILSGDGNINDDQVTSWPPSEHDIGMYLMDNAHHVIQLVFCGKGAISTKIEGVTIEHGFAHEILQSTSRVDRNNNDFNEIKANFTTTPQSLIESGIYYKDHFEPIDDYNCGGGFYSSLGTPTLSKCVIKNNYSNRRGGGLFGRNGPGLVKNCLFEGNRANGDNSEGGGAIYNNLSSLDIINCTFTNNGGIIIPEGAGAIGNEITENAASSAKIVNTILWNNHESHTSELFGGNFNVSYSCVDGGYLGTKNIALDPVFEIQSNPKGEDGFYGGYDDGLQLSKTSPCIGAGITIVDVNQDQNSVYHLNFSLNIRNL